MRAQAELQQFLAQLDAGHEAQVAQAKQLLLQQQERQEAAARAAAEEEQRQAELAAEHEQLTLEDLCREVVRLSQVGSQWLCCPDRTAIVTCETDQQASSTPALYTGLPSTLSRVWHVLYSQEGAGCGPCLAPHLLYFYSVPPHLPYSETSPLAGLDRDLHQQTTPALLCVRVSASIAA